MAHSARLVSTKQKIITDTFWQLPKGWAQFDFLGTIKERYNIPAAWTTDVNAAAYGELKQGAAQGKIVVFTLPWEQESVQVS